MERVDCIICDSNMSTPFIKVSDRFGSESFQIVECECGFKYLSPRPKSENISIYYDDENYDPHRKHKYSLYHIIYSWVQDRAIKWKYYKISKFTNIGKLLDIGGGGGEFCSYLKKCGWQVSLQDNSARARKLSLDNGVDCLKNLNDIKKEQFDLITMWHSIEHIHGIDSLFKSLDKLIAVDGTLVVAVPNFNAPERKWYNEDWAPWDAPRHLYHFNYEQLIILLEKYGWKVKSSNKMIQDTPYNILLSMKSRSIFQCFNALFIFIYSIIKIAFGSTSSSSSFMLICKKN